MTRRLWPRAVVWLFAQLIPWMLGILGWQLWARNPQAREQTTLGLLVGVQFMAASMLSAWLFIDLSSLLFVASTSMLLVLLAVIAADQSLTLWLAVDAGSVVWFCLLFSLTKFFPSRLGQAWGAIAASVLVAVAVASTIIPRLLDGH